MRSLQILIFVAISPEIHSQERPGPSNFSTSEEAGVLRFRKVEKCLQHVLLHFIGCFWGNLLVLRCIQ